VRGGRTGGASTPPSFPLLHYYAMLNYLPCVAEFEISKQSVLRYCVTTRNRKNMNSMSETGLINPGGGGGRPNVALQESNLPSEIHREIRSSRNKSRLIEALRASTLARLQHYHHFTFDTRATAHIVVSNVTEARGRGAGEKERQRMGARGGRKAGANLEGPK